MAFSALSRAIADDNRRAVCPHLCSLEICNGPEATDAEVTGIERCLQRRKKLGAISLERFIVEFKDENGRASTLSKKYIVDRLRDLVSTVILKLYTEPEHL